MKYKIKIYKTANGKRPFIKWLEDLSDMKARVAIEIRLNRLEIGTWANVNHFLAGFMN